MPDVQPLQPGDPAAIGAYRLTGRLGQGGQGVVYLGTGPDLRPVAVKLLQAHLDAGARQRFVRELAATKRVARFCTAQVIDADLDGDRPFIVSEYVEGRSLAAAVAAEGVLSDGALERLATGTLTALTAIHQAGVVHRDFKPDNVILGHDGPRVIDFGIAKALDAAALATQPSGIIGTPAYMAPEQVRGEAVGRPSDVWAWAATLVFAATGVPPFGLDGITTVIGRILHADPNLGAMSGPLRELVRDALAKDPQARPSAQELLLRLLGGPELPAATGAPATALLELGEDRAAPETTTFSPAFPVPPGPGPGQFGPAYQTPGPGGQFATTRPVPSGRGFRPGVAVASALVAALLVGGGALLASNHLGDDGRGSDSDVVLSPSATPTDDETPAPQPSEEAPVPQPTTSRSASASQPPAQTATLRCTDTGTYTLDPDENAGGIGFDAVGGRLTWSAATSGPGSLSSTSGALAAGEHAYLTLSLTEGERATDGSSTITVTTPQGTCTRTITWSAPTAPSPTPTPPDPTPTATPEPSPEPQP